MCCAEDRAREGPKFLAGKIRAAAAAHIVRARALRPAEDPILVPTGGKFNPLGVIAIGASTGGTEAIEQVLMSLSLIHI